MHDHVADNIRSIKPKTVIPGRFLNHCRKEMTAAQRAHLVWEMREGLAIPTDFTMAQLCRLVGASPSHVAAIAAMSDTEREMVKDDNFKLGAFIKEKQSVAQLDRLVETVPDRVLAALDRATAPR